MTDELNNVNAQEEEEKVLLVIPDYEDAEETDEAEYRQRAINSRIHLTEEELAPTKPIEMNLWQRIENFFFHYKKVVIAVAFVVVTIVLGIVFSQQTPRDYDIHIYTSEQQLELHQLTVVLDEYLSQYAEDLDGDGQETVISEYYDLTANQFYAVYDDNGEMVLKEDGDPLTEPISKANPENYIEYIAASTAIDNDISKCKTYLIMVDELNYQAITEMYGEEVFVDLGGTRAIPLYEDEAFAEYCEENGITTKLSLCLVSKNEKTLGDDELLEKWENAYDYAQRVLEACPGLI